MIFDGSELQLKDSVYDVAYGSGHVCELIDRAQTFRVDFGGRTFAYSLLGISTFQRKTLYWRDPVGGYIPPKDTVTWDKFSAIRGAVASILGLGN